MGQIKSRFCPDASASSNAATSNTRAKCVTQDDWHSRQHNQTIIMGQTNLRMCPDALSSSNEATSNTAKTMDTGQTHLMTTTDKIPCSVRFFEISKIPTNDAIGPKQIPYIDKSFCEEAFSKLKLIDRGGYGNIVLVRPRKNTESSEDDLSIVIKKIKCEHDDAKMKYATREKLPERRMHFGIVPIWAWTEDTDTKTCYFVLPFMENESLLGKLQQDGKSSPGQPLILKNEDRLKILYHVACALTFLHKKMPNNRSSFVTTSNIMLDSTFNARLLDFGLAVNYTQGKDWAALETNPDELDLLNFGTVIIEVLSSYPDCYAKQEELLKDFKENKQIVWGEHSATISKCLSKIATQCRAKPICCAVIKEKLEAKLREKNWSCWTDPEPASEKNICMLCLINEVETDAKHFLDHNTNCENLHVCTACMRNSNRNPIECHTCFEAVQPVIGHQWAAVLVAGNDIKDKALAKAFVNDLNKVFEAITSTQPMTMGISKERVQCVKPGKPGTSQKLLLELNKSFKCVESKAIHSLLFYFTGHHEQKTGFMLGDKDEYLEIEKLKGYIKDAVDKSGCKRVLVLLDCCEAPDIDLKLTCSYYQINSCSMDQLSYARDAGSLMTGFFVQALKGQSSTGPCPNEPCKICKDFQSDKGFLKIDALYENVSKHIRDSNTKQNVPRKVSGNDWTDTVIAYFTDKLSTVKFSLHDRESSDTSPEGKNHSDKYEDLVKTPICIGDIGYCI